MTTPKPTSPVRSSDLVRAWRPLIRKIVAEVDYTFADYESEWAQKQEAVAMIKVKVKDVVKASRWLRQKQT